jgi:drug/metabolite transporter (DMT)-like permease
MFYLSLSILLSTVIIVTFKVFDRFKISVVQAITVNYLVASVFGFASESASFDLISLPNQPWFYFSALMGLSLIVAFNLFALSAQKAGVAITAISSRMSVAIPIVLGFFLFQDSSGVLKITGIIIGLVAFYLTTKKDKAIKLNKSYFYLPVILFLAIGVNDSLMKIAEHYFITDDFVPFLATSFGFSLIFGLIIFIFKTLKEKKKVEGKNIFAGVILGLLNWYSTLFVLKGLGVFEVSLFMPVYNIGVVALASVTGFVIFREKLTRINWIGIFLAIIAIILIANSDFFYQFQF